jgi:hypothetical protein
MRKVIGLKAEIPATRRRRRLKPTAEPTKPPEGGWKSTYETCFCPLQQALFFSRMVDDPAAQTKISVA